MGRQLKPDWQDEADDFDITFRDQGCTCFLAPPCSYCLHPGNPLNLEETEEAWEVVEENPSKKKILVSGSLVGRASTALALMSLMDAKAQLVLAPKRHNAFSYTPPFHNAHLRAKPLPKLKRCKKTGYITNGTRN
ncbi:hypothetical protein [Marinomonas atlantica]|uniref:hypothetical protein n=1 Tax=Marinomonas atlantica TaxID=1806668 RepID=UPI00082C7A55|nr:hypothetical protein [Marinomonas atlantica]